MHCSWKWNRKNRKNPSYWPPENINSSDYLRNNIFNEGPGTSFKGIARPKLQNV